jgi:hypothetical protein
MTKEISMRAHPAVRSMPVLALFLALLLSAATAVSAQTADAPYPGDTWMRYNSVEDAGLVEREVGDPT